MFIKIFGKSQFSYNISLILLKLHKLMNFSKMSQKIDCKILVPYLETSPLNYIMLSLFQNLSFLRLCNNDLDFLLFHAGFYNLARILTKAYQHLDKRGGGRAPPGIFWL